MITPQSRVITIEYGEMQFGQMWRSASSISSRIARRSRDEIWAWKHTRDRARRVGSKDSPAHVPVVVVVAVPAGLLPVRRKWARRQWWSKIQVEGIRPT